jgi:hypothetical protein
MRPHGALGDIEDDAVFGGRHRDQVVHLFRLDELLLDARGLGALAVDFFKQRAPPIVDEGLPLRALRQCRELQLGQAVDRIAVFALRAQPCIA